MKKSLFFVVVLFVIAGMWVTSCTENKPTGMIGPGKIQLTSTPTPTPDVNFSVLIHQEGTPVVGVGITVMRTGGEKVTGTTEADGKAWFKINEFGDYTVKVNEFDGFTSQIFQAQPFETLSFEVDYGCPKFELDLMQGDENIDLAISDETDNVLIYRARYRTNFEREDNVFLDTKGKIEFEVLGSNVVKNEGDEVHIKLEVPDSFEGYNSDNGTKLEIQAFGEKSLKFVAKSNVRVLKKGWRLNLTGELMHAQYYQKHKSDNNNNVSYYTGMKNMKVSVLGTRYSVSSVKFDILEVQNIGSNNAVREIKAAASCDLNWVSGYGCYQMKKIKSYNQKLCMK